MKQRHTFHVTALESLEDRQLLNGASAAGMLARLQQRAAHVAALGQQKAAAAAFKAARAVPQGTVGRAFTTPQPNGKANPLPAFLNVSPSSRRSLTPADLKNLGSSPLPGQVNLNTSSLGLGSTLNALPPGGYGRLRPGSYPAQLGGDSIAISTGAASSAAGVGGGSVRLGSLPTTVNVPNGPALSPAAPTTDVTTNNTTATIGQAKLAAMPGMFAGMLDGVKPTKAEVDGLKTAVDTFAGAYTSGTDAAKDKAAADALRSSLDDLATSAWGRSHVATPASIAALKTAVDGFASSYTSGTNPSADKAAWKALQTGLDAFTKGLNGRSGDPAAPGDDFGPGPGMFPMPTGGFGFMGIDDGLLSGPALTKAELTTLQKTVADFAASYTAGADAGKDQGAADAFQTGLGNLLSDHWRHDMPMPPDMPVGPAATTDLVTAKSLAISTASANARTLASAPTPINGAPTVQPLGIPISARAGTPPRGPLGPLALRGINPKNLFATAGVPTRRA